MFPEIEEYLRFIEMDKSTNTLVVYRSAINKMFDFLKIETLNDLGKVTSLDLRNHQANLRKSGLQESSVNSRMRPIKAMFNWMIENEYLSKNPMRSVKQLKTPKKVVEILTDEEQQRLVSVCEDVTDKLVMVLLLTTGLRREELCSLQLNNYDGTHIKVLGKGNKERVLALQEPVIKLMDQYLVWRNKKYGNKTNALIVSKAGSHYTGNAILKKLKSIMKESGMPEEKIMAIHVHSLRHTFVANMLDSGADIFVCKEALGHADISTTMIYAHLTKTALDNAMKNQKSIL